MKTAQLDDFVRVTTTRHYDRRTRRLRLILVVVGIHVLLVLFAIGFLTPFYWLAISGIKPLGEIYSIPISIIPKQVRLLNFLELFEKTTYLRSFLNSLIVATTVTIGTVFFCSLAGFGFAKYSFRGRDVLFLIMLASMMIPLAVLLIPTFVLMARLGLVNTLWPVILPFLAPPFGIFWMRQYISSVVSDELLEAGRLDGADEFTIYYRIVIPVIGPAIAGLAVWSFMWSWISFMPPLIYLRAPNTFTYPIVLSFLQNQLVEKPTHLVMAGATLSVVPVILVFLFLQRHFIAGITAGAVKQ